MLAVVVALVGVAISVRPLHAAAAAPKPFFNPTFLAAADERLELEKDFFRRLLPNIRTFLFNAGAAGVDKIKEAIGA